MKRAVRDRTEELPLFASLDYSEEGKVAWQWSIEAKLHPSHKGIGSWALLWANSEEHLRRLYDEMFPGRVIVNLKKAGKAQPVAYALKRASGIEQTWLKKPVKPEVISSMTGKRVVRER